LIKCLFIKKYSTAPAVATRPAASAGNGGAYSSTGPPTEGAGSVILARTDPASSAGLLREFIIFLVRLVVILLGTTVSAPLAFGLLGTLAIVLGAAATATSFNQRPFVSLFR
jgi:hypothetical protein